MKRATLFDTTNSVYVFEPLESRYYHAKEAYAEKIMDKYFKPNAFTLQKNDTIFFAPKGRLTRHDQQKLKDDFEIKRVRSIDESKYAVITKDFFKSIIVEPNWWGRTLYKTKELLNILINIDDYTSHLPNGITLSIEIIQEKIEALNKVVDEYVICTQNQLNFLSSTNYRFNITNFWSSVGLETENIPAYLSEDDYNLLKVFVSNKHKVIDEEALVSACRGSNPFTASNYDSIVKMLSSSNPDDRELAVTMLGGFNAKENITPLAKLWFKYSERISDTKSFRHAGFRLTKSLLDTIYVSNHANFLRSLSDNGLLNAELQEFIIIDKLFALNADYNATNSGIFVIEEIKLKEGWNNAK